MRRLLFPWLTVGSAILGLAPLAWAEPELESEPTESLSVPGSVRSLPDDLLPGARIVEDGRPISVSEAIALSIRNNLDVEVERFAPVIAESDSEGAWGVYDPTISADYAYDVQKAPNVNPFNSASGSIDRTVGAGVGIDQLIPYLGASLNFRFDSSKNKTNSTFQVLDPQYDSSVFISAKFPLARNLLWNEAWTNVKISEIAYHASEENFRTALMDNVLGTIDSYWNLVATRDQVRVAQKSLETARALVAQTETQYEVGVVSRVEVVEAEAGVADREFELIRTANVYRNAQDEFIDLVLGRELSALTVLQFAPTEDPESYEVPDVNIERSVRQAFRSRPELAFANRRIEQGEVDLRFAKNQRLPQLDADIRYGFIGISGDGNSSLDPIFGTPPPDTSRGDSTKDFFKSDGADNLRVQATFSIPFPNTTARKRAVRSELELRRAKTQRLRLEQTIILEVRRAARLLMASAQGIDAAERRRVAATEQLRAERVRLEHGESTPFEVLQRESDLVGAESQKIAALQTYRSAEIGLERARGTILESQNVVTEKAREFGR